MEIITKYKADDGTEFLSQDNCLTYEANCRIAEEIMRPLGDRPDTCEYANGHGYLRHDKQVVLAARRAFLEFVKRYTAHRWIIESLEDDNKHPSWAHRIIGEAAPYSIAQKFNRFCLMDKDYREWGQGYYAANPHTGEQICLNEPSTEAA